MARVKKYKMLPFLSTGVPKDSFAMIYESMMKSKAYMELSARQQSLLTACYQRRIGHAPPKGKPGHFIMTPQIWHDEYRIYCAGADTRFRKDMQALISKGFIDCVEDHSKDRKANIYRYSARWHYYGTKDYKFPISVMTNAMRREQRAA